MVNAYNRNLQAQCFYKGQDDTYYTFSATNWFFKLYLDEINRAQNENRIIVFINNVTITPTDYIIEELSDGIYVRFKKANFPYILTDTDFIYLIADIEYRG